METNDTLKMPDIEEIQTAKEQTIEEPELNIQYEEEKKPTKPAGVNGFAIASMVCGILSILCCCITIISIILGIVAVILGIIALNQGPIGKGMAIAGIVTGALGGIIGLLSIIVVITSGIFSADLITEMQNFI